MKEYAINKLQIIIILIFSVIDLISSASSCKNYTFCFECISDKDCIWDTNKCKTPKEVNLVDKIFNINNDFTPRKCFEQKDNATLNYINTYCGTTLYNFKENTEKLTISLPVHNATLYGTKSLYCEYTILNKDAIDSFTIQSTKNWGNLRIKIKYFYTNLIGEITLGDGDKYIYKDLEEIKIIFESNIQKNIPPFNIEIADTFSTLNKTILAIIIFCCLVGFIIIVVLFIIWIKRRKKILINNNINNLNNIYINNVNIINNMNTDRMGLMNYLTTLKPIKFKDIQKDIKDINNMKCTIDLENFEPESDVILTKCLHLFHYDCLKTFIEKNKNKKELNCPLCFTNLYTTSIFDENRNFKK